MSLNPSLANQDYLANHNNRTSFKQSEMVDAFCDMYDTHARRGSCTTMTIAGIGKSTIRSLIMAWSSSSDVNVIVLAQAIAGYWASEHTPKGGFVSVSNNAMSKTSALETVIRSSLSENVVNGGIKSLIERTDVVVKTINYIGTTSSGSTTTGNVS